MQKKITALLFTVTFFMFSLAYASGETQNAVKGKIDAAAALDQVLAEGKEEQQETILGERIATIVTTDAMINEIVTQLCIVFNVEERQVLKKLFDMMLEFELVSHDPAFKEQWTIFMEVSEMLSKKGASEDEIKEVAVMLEDKCALVIKQNYLYEQLQSFYKGLGKGMANLRLDEILAKISVGLTQEQK